MNLCRYDERNDPTMKRYAFRRIFLGLLFIVLGLLVFGQILDFVQLGPLARSWWTLFIIVPGILGIIESGFQFWNIALVAVGAWLLAIDQHWIGPDAWLWLLGALLILLGFKTLFNLPSHSIGKIGTEYYSNANFNQDNNSFPEYSAVFSSIRISNTSKSLKGGKASSVFGKITMDLREIELEGQTVFEVASVFGSMEILVPKNIPVQFEITPVFGTYHNAAAFTSPDGHSPCIIFRGASVFGTIEIL